MASEAIRRILWKLNLGALPFKVPLAIATVPTIFSVIITCWVTFDKKQDQLLSPEISLKCFANGLLNGDTCSFCPETYDFVVVGGGSAGMVVATRLGNNSKGYSVLLLEAGGEPSVINNIPFLSSFLTNKPENTWRYQPPPQKNSSFGCFNSSPTTTRGKMLGGSSSTNFMVYARGNKEDYNGWARMLDDPQWNYASVLDYFKKSEDYKGFYPFDPTYHGSGGLLGVGTTDFLPGADQFLTAARERGYQVGDYNGAQQLFGYLDLTTRDGWRENTYKAFYADTGAPKNLKIKKYAFATKISFNGKRSVSVTYERHGCTRTVTARKEIILSAGVFHSPQLLMLSGIGPQNELQQLNISVVANLPVGHQMEDHVLTTMGPIVKSPVMNLERDTSVGAVSSYFTSGKGILSSATALSVHGFFRSPSANYPNLQLLPMGFHNTRNFSVFFNDLLGFNTTFIDELIRNLADQDIVLPLVILGRPKSSGVLKLATKNPRDLPIPDPKYFSDPEDVETLLWGLKETLALYENTTALNGSLNPIPMPGCESHVFRSDDYFRCCIRTFSVSLFHHCGTNAMGKVVDSNLRVMGIVGLRVIDGSVIPSIPNGNVNAPIIMIAEKGAEILMNQYSMK